MARRTAPLGVVLGFCFLSLLSPVGAWAQPRPAGPERDRPTTSVPWRIWADNFRGTRGAAEVGDLINVRVEHDSLRISADRGRWDQTSSVATLWGDVRLSEGNAVVTCARAVYFTSTDVAELAGGVHAVDGAFVASADSARVERSSDRVTLWSNAVVHDEAGEIRADDILYDRAAGISVATGKVVVTDRESGSTVTGERLVYNDETQLAIVTGEPRLTSREEGQKPMRVRAEELRLYRREGRAEALRGVRIWQGEVRANAARAEMDDRAGRVWLTGSPVAWDPDGRIEADTLVVAYEEREVRAVEARGHVVVEQAPSAGDRVGERTLAYGDRAEAVFVDGVVDSLVVEGSATSDHYPAPVDLAAGSGVNHSRAQRIVLYMEEGRARRIRLAGDAAGRYWFEPESTGAPAESSVRAGGASGSDVPDSSAAPDTTAAPDTIATPDATAAPPDSSLPAPETDARATDRSAVPAGDTLQVLTLSAILAPPPPEPAPVDSAAADSIAWAERVRSLDAITPPDSLFPAGIDDVTYGGDVVEFEVETREIRLRKNAKVEYHDATLRSGEVVFDAARQEVDATDEPVLSDPGGTLTGRTMCYDVESREGVVFEGRTEFEGGYYSGRRIKKLEDDDLLVDHAVYTTCDRLEPHFHFLAPSMRIRLRDKVVGRPMVLHIARIPVLAVPFFVFPIEKGRRSGFLTPEIEVGISDDRGRFVRNLGYYWAFSDYVDATTWLDFFERNPRWIGYLQSRYKKRYLLEGQVYASAALELPERETSPDIATGRSRRWELRARHSQELSPTASLKLDANFVSDQQFLFDQGLGTNVEQQADRLLRSNLTLSKSWPEASLTVNMSRRQDLEARGGEIEVASTAPSITFGLNRRTLGRRAQGRDKGRLPWLASVSYGWSARLEQPVTQVKGGDTSRDAAMVQDLSVSDSRKLLGVIGILPTFSYSQFLFERDNRGERWQRAGRWSAGMSANTTLYGTFTPPFGPVAAFRHVMVPSVTFSYHPRITSGTYVDDTGRTVARFPSVGGISFGNAARSRRLGLSIQNRFQAKIRSGDTVRKLDELASLSLSTSYDFEKDKEPLAPISSSFRTRPLNAFNLDLSAVYDPYEERLTSLSVSTNASISGAAAAALPAGHEFAGDDPSLGRREGLLGEEERAAPGQPWRLSLGHTYSRGRSSSDFTSTLRGQLGLSLTRNWQLSYSANVDMREREFVTHSLSVHRDLHCWQAQFERRFFRGSASYYFRIGVKDIQEVFYERRGGS